MPEVRVVNEDGQQLGVMSTDAARDVANRLGLDLVEISPNAHPPVCKIMDYGRYKYELKKKASVAKKSQHQSQVKEVKFRPQISEHDLDFKLKNARRFLFEGDKVKCTVMFRGREIVHTQIGRKLLRSVAERLEVIASPESEARMEGRTLSFTLAPNRTAIERLKISEEQLRKNAELAAQAEDAENSENAEEVEEAKGAVEAPEVTEKAATEGTDSA